VTLLRALDMPDRCANLACPNLPHEGRFVLLDSDELVVGPGHRALQLWMCAPCAHALSPNSRAVTGPDGNPQQAESESR
jgi:hypothetical protein